MSVHRILEELKKSLRPDGALIEHRDEVVAQLNAQLEKRDIDARTFPGGSTAKNTYLAGDHDIDLFVRFSMQYAESSEQLADLVEPCLKQFSPERIHGSRDYFQFTYEGYDFEVVPVLAVDHHEQAMNITDMSPLHVMYFQDKNDAFEDEIRLAKQFCKAARVYGAESYVRGFSGHVIDLLILHYKTFMQLVKAASRWEIPVVIDIEGHHEDPLRSIDPARHAPLVLVDPVQPNRNAAAALSKDAFTRFSERCTAFLKHPSAELFVMPEFSEQAIRTHLSSLPGKSVFLYAKHPEEDKKDVAGARIRKAFEKFGRALKQHGFSIVEQGWHFEYKDDSFLWFLVEEHSLPRLMERQGPPVENEQDTQRFRETHPECTERDGRLYATVEREVTRPDGVLDTVLKPTQEFLRVSLRPALRARPEDV